MNDHKKILALVMAMVMVVAAMSGCAQQAAAPAAAPAEGAPAEAPAAKDEKDYKIAVVVGESSNPWYVRTGEGVEMFAKERGIDAYQKAPTAADAAAQVQVVEDVIAQGIDALCVIPVTPESLEAVLKKAQDKGIVVITHEGSTVQNKDYDIEAFVNKEYGAFMMDQLAERIGAKGKYVAVVSFLTASSHNEWADGAIERQKEAYPDMELIPEEKLESEDNQETAYNRVKEILKKYPDLAGIIGTSSFDAPGAQKAINELGLQDSCKVVGTSVTSLASEYINEGTMECFTLWDPALSVYAMCDLAVKMLNGEEIKDGVDLGIDGYREMKFDETGKILQGAGWLVLDKSNMNDYNF